MARFYAPWCGHCQNLKPAYEKAAKNLAGLAKVAAINCDEDSNKAFCGQMGVKGFPTLKIVKPGSKPGRPIVEDYQGARTAKAMVETVVDKIPNHVQKLQDSGLSAWLTKNNDTAKAILFTEKGTISALLKSVAIDFLGGVSVAQVRNKEAATVEMFGISEFPSLVLLPGGEQRPVQYDGEMKKEALVAFLSQIVPPNPDPAPKKVKASSSKKPKPSSSQASAFSEASRSHKSADASDFAGSASEITLDDLPTESPNPIVPPAETPVPVLEVAPPIPTLSTPAEVKSACLAPRSGTCVLALLPSTTESQADMSQFISGALTGLAEIADKHVKRQAKIFPFYAVPAENEVAKTIRGDLGLNLDTELEIVAVNMKRAWWRRYGGETFDLASIEGFVDSIKLGEGTKEKLPDSFFGEVVEEVKASEELETTPEAPEPVPAEPDLDENEAQESDLPVEAPEPEPIEAEHDEL
jgi:protein disulfide-isomerase A6